MSRDNLAIPSYCLIRGYMYVSCDATGELLLFPFVTAPSIYLQKIPSRYPTVPTMLKDPGIGSTYLGAS